MQKMQRHTNEDVRYFWNIKTDLAEGEYRSRCSTPKAVRDTLTRLGHKVESITKAQA